MQRVAAMLAAVGDLHALGCIAGGLVVLFWSLHLASQDALKPAWRRLTWIAASAMLLAMAQRFGRELLEVRGIPSALWWVGFFVMPVLMVLNGGARVFAALIWIACIGVLLERLGDWIADGAAINGAMILLALGAWLLALAGQRFDRRATHADSTSGHDAEALADRLASREAQEAADKYTRE